MNDSLDQYDKDEQQMIIQRLENRGEKTVEEVLADVSRQTLQRFREILIQNGHPINAANPKTGG